MRPVTTAAIAWAAIDSQDQPGRTAANHERWRSCPICGAFRERTIFEQPAFQFFSDSQAHAKRMTLREVQCQACYALYKNPCYSAHGMRVLFREAGRSYGNASHAQAQVEWLTAQGLLEGRTSVLDVGCGSGRFLSCLPQTWRRLGIEPDAALSAQCQAAGLSGVTHAADDAWPATGEPLDLITLWHVLEHVPDPVGTLTRLGSLAHAHTRLVVEVPILELGATPDITGFLSPQHVTHFSVNTLDVALARAGWRTVFSQGVEGYNGWRIIAEPDQCMDQVTPALGDVKWLARYCAAQADHLVHVECLVNLAPAPQRVIWGAGMHTESLYQLTTLFRRRPGQPYVLIDRDPVKQGTTWRGIPVFAPDAVLPQIDWSETDLLISSYGDQTAMVAAARGFGVPEARIITLYEPDTVRSY
mgnify:FL=1